MSSVSMPQPDANMNWDPGGITPIRNNHLYLAIAAANTNTMNTDEGPNIESRTDLDSHANMPVIGGGAYILAKHNRVCKVSPDTPDYEQ